jgi:hypothetical protein
LIVCSGTFANAASAPPVDDTIPDEQGVDDGSLDETIPLIDPATQTTLPAGCTAPRSAMATFLGELISSDDLIATFRVLQVRGGSLGAYVNSGLITVRYSTRETKFLRAGETYLVGAGASELFSTLESKVSYKKELFGGDAVVGADESDTPCPTIEDPVITLKPNGQLIDTGVFSLLLNERNLLFGAVALAIVVVLIFLIGIVVTKLLFVGAARGAFRSKRSRK